LATRAIICHEHGVNMTFVHRYGIGRWTLILMQWLLPKCGTPGLRLRGFCGRTCTVRILLV